MKKGRNEMNENIFMGGYLISRNQINILHDEMLNDAEGYYFHLGKYICYLASKGIYSEIEFIEDLPIVVFACLAPDNEPSIPLYSNRKVSIQISQVGGQ